MKAHGRTRKNAGVPVIQRCRLYRNQTRQDPTCGWRKRMKQRTTKLTGEPLDWAVAKAKEAQMNVPAGFYTDMVKRGNFMPSTSWNAGGPILDSEIHASQKREGYHYTSKRCPKRGWIWSYGDTLLESAMRTYAAYYLGDEIDVPDEMVQA